MSKYIGKRKLFKILNQRVPCQIKMKDCTYEFGIGDECISYVANNFQFYIFVHSYGTEFVYAVNKLSDFFDYYTVFEEKIHPVFVEK